VQAQRGLERECTGEAHGQENKGSEGALGPCHGGGGVSIGRRFKEAVAAAEGSVRARSRLGEEEIDAWKGRSRRWSGDGVERWLGELYRWREQRAHVRGRKQRSTGARVGRQRT
jgi:hypothetical protein